MNELMLIIIGTTATAPMGIGSFVAGQVGDDIMLYHPRNVRTFMQDALACLCIGPVGTRRNNMTEKKNALAQLFAKCWKDEALKARFMSEPKAVLKEHGLDVPDNLDVKVVENADDCVHITLPAPPTGHMDLSDDELRKAAGGIYGSDWEHLTASECCH